MSEEELITLTPAAQAHIQSIMQRHEGAVGFRLSVTHTGCSGYMYAPEIITEANDQDLVVYVNSSLMIYIDPHCIQYIQGLEIDFVKKSLGIEQLVYNNPNVDTTCGCGESFSLKEGEEDADK